MAKWVAVVEGAALVAATAWAVVAVAASGWLATRPAAEGRPSKVGAAYFGFARVRVFVSPADLESGAAKAPRWPFPRNLPAAPIGRLALNIKTKTKGT